MPLPSGKVNPYELAEIVFPYLELEDERVLVGPDVGLDASVIDCGEKVLVFSSDPITGAIKDPGWLSVHVNANDVATIGAAPRWFLINLFLPEGVDRSQIRNIMKRANDACRDLDVSIVGGHTEVTPGLDRVLISGAMAGEAPADGWVSAAQAKPGDRLLFTKSAAVEGTFILALDRGEELEREYGPDLVDRAESFREKLSVVPDALTAIETGGVHAMHDPTEGGLAGGLHELADASQVGFSIDSEKIPVAEETRKICNYFEIDPIRTIGSGSLLICVNPEKCEEVIDSLEGAGIGVSNIGSVLKNKEKRVIDGKTLEFPEQDELWKIFE
ncbi:hypothetical protein AKJ37_02400 [candidate division MSBL1 archaeon SCGC-AAA259I09]|uniref:Hydrogenase n=4 Tax=candidate division MSBL1 TaxID=215777 RepID=A0A133UUC6_9EURY|nr:hypothetical protein AKJ62_04335 [candidate division MSBL1 archaeon SCGC-AAA259D14]KXA97730.1 hypothetical protein AKJ37_02400 [candidate division MSBL1 archaeon SCGC-AAA259I09]KXB00231.1 hypothetical protein AKJ40_01630 [candidate division MSBL1 archaeon SCGC-AAA259M10]